MQSGPGGQVPATGSGPVGEARGRPPLRGVSFLPALEVSRASPGRYSRVFAKHRRNSRSPGGPTAYSRLKAFRDLVLAVVLQVLSDSVPWQAKTPSRRPIPVGEGSSAVGRRTERNFGFLRESTAPEGSPLRALQRTRSSLQNCGRGIQKTATARAVACTRLSR